MKKFIRKLIEFYNRYFYKWTDKEILDREG